MNDASLLLNHIATKGAGQGEVTGGPTREQVAKYFHHMRYEKYLSFSEWSVSTEGLVQQREVV